MDRVLEQESGNHGGETEELSVHRCAKSHAHENGGGGVGFQGPLDVPFPIQFSQAPFNSGGIGSGVTGDILFGSAADLLIDRFSGMPGYSLYG